MFWREGQRDDRKAQSEAARQSGSEIEREREKEICSIYWVTPQMVTMTKTVPG